MSTVTQYTPDLIERFYAKVSKTPTEQGCLEWMAYHDPRGYGFFAVGNGKTLRAHRVAWELVNGAIPEGLFVRHFVCNNPRCVNVDHLRLGTHADNMHDIVTSGRWHNAPNTTAPYVRPVGPTDEERFYAKVSKTPNETGCLDWLGGLRNGYGHFNTRGKYFYAHRLAWELVNGPIPPGMCACHACDRRICCNPAHIFIGSKAENMHDMIAKGRADHTDNCRGEAVGTSKLTAIQVMEIRSPQYGGWTLEDIASQYNVSKQLVWQILHRKAWKHI